MTVYELIDRILGDLNKIATNILATAQNISTLRDALKANDAAQAEKGAEEEGKKNSTEA